MPTVTSPGRAECGDADNVNRAAEAIALHVSN
jgi:hypothetical protein